MTYTAVAEASGVGRATLYRHWPRIEDLVSDTIAELATTVDPGPTGDLRSDLHAALHTVAEMIDDPASIQAILALAERALRDNHTRQLMDRIERSTPTWLALENGLSSGQLDAATNLDHAVAQVGGPILYRRIMLGLRADLDFVDYIIDNFINQHEPEPANHGGLPRPSLAAGTDPPPAS